ncbi:MAG: hypothetical protein R3308_03200 [Thiohalobacterales bacterium]|nr:hypothetical protein [Thiohalobacterales bacterium]
MIRSKTLTMFLTTGTVIATVAGPVALAADVEALAGDCNGCHGTDGVSTEPTVPTIAGFSAQYIIDSMMNFREEARPCGEATYSGGPNKGKTSDMCKAAAGLSEGDIEALGAYYADKTFVPAKQEFDAAKASQGEEIHSNCDKCHEDAGSAPEDDAGLLAGQWTPYLKLALDQFLSGERPPPKKMKKKLDKLSPDDIDALLHYYASRQ